MTKKLSIIACLLFVSFIWFVCIMPKGEPMYIGPMLGMLIALGLTFHELFEK